MRPRPFLYAAVFLPLTSGAADYEVLGYETIDIPVGRQGAVHGALPRPAAGMPADAVRRTTASRPHLRRWSASHRSVAGSPGFRLLRGDIGPTALHPAATE